MFAEETLSEALEVAQEEVFIDPLRGGERVGVGSWGGWQGWKEGLDTH